MIWYWSHNLYDSSQCVESANRRAIGGSELGVDGGLKSMPCYHDIYYALI